jgi:electron transport complex protein RnfG
MREILKPALVLFLVCAMTTIALAGIKSATQSTIDTRIAQELEQAKKDVLPAAAKFEALGSDKVAAVIKANPGNEFLATIENVYLGSDAAGNPVGTVYGVKSRGYDAAGVKMTIGIDTKGTILDIKVTEQLETPGLGSNVLDPLGAYMPQYRGKAPTAAINLVKTSPAAPEDIQAISGATITSRAVSRAVEGALEFSRSLAGPGGIQ